MDRLWGGGAVANVLQRYDATPYEITNKGRCSNLRCCSWWCQAGLKLRSKHTKQVIRHAPASRMNSGISGQVGQESNLPPTVLETQSYVSGSVAHHRHMPICLIICVV